MISFGKPWPLFLVAEGHAEVATAGSLCDALLVVKADPAYDLVLLDYNMPGMNGLDGLRQMQTAMGDTPVAIVLGHDHARAGR